MHNTIPLTLMLMLTSVSASAQFYTITKETEINGKLIVVEKETAEIKEDTFVISESVQSLDLENENEKMSGRRY